MLLNLVRINLVNYRIHSFSTRMLSSHPIKVQVSQGIVVGQENPLPHGNVYHSFQGIPYAVPPLGSLRFKSPVPLERFDVPELDCLKERDVSYQRDLFSSESIGSENCLHLNVYAPQSKMAKGPLPVMVWIHGGGFVFGHGNSDTFLPLSLMEEDVIVVTLNYRLSALGFLCLPEEGIWGNAGLKDQRLALQWVQDNIKHFNGDPNNVTLFGESAGAASVHLHSYAKHANKLFHKAIMQSGTANMEWVFQYNPAYKVRKLAESLGLQNTSDTKKLLEFLQSPKVTPMDVLKNFLKVLTPAERRRNLPLPFKPVVEDSQSPDSIIDQAIMDRLKQPNSMVIPSIMGYNSAEGMAMIIDAVRKVEEYDRDFKRLVPKNIPLSQDDPESNKIATQMRDFYMKGHTLTPKRFNELCNILTDYHFMVDMQKAAELQVRLQPQAPLYFYRFEYVGGRNLYKKLLQMENLKGACHGDELFYLFQMAGNDEEPIEADQNVTKQLSSLWANFAKHANPTPEEEEDCAIPCKWLPVRKPESEHSDFVLDYLCIDGKGEMKSNPDKERNEFWRSIYKTYPPALDYSTLRAKL